MRDRLERALAVPPRAPPWGCRRAPTAQLPPVFVAVGAEVPAGIDLENCLVEPVGADRAAQWPPPPTLARLEGYVSDIDRRRPGHRFRLARHRRCGDGAVAFAVPMVNRTGAWEPRALSGPVSMPGNTETLSESG
jgi:hypothetical protein